MAAVVLGLIALVGLLGAVLVLGASVFLTNPIIQRAPSVHAAMIGFGCCTLAFFAFCGAIAIGLLRMRSWARICVAIVGGVIFVLSGLSAIGVFLARGYVPPVPLPAGGANVQTVMVGIAVFYFLLSLVGVWWLVYFNLPAVRAVFAAARSPELPAPEPNEAV